MKKESKAKLNAIHLASMRNMLNGFIAFATALVVVAGVKDASDTVKEGKAFYREYDGVARIDSDDKKHINKDVAICIVALAVLFAVINRMRRAKKINDAAAVRIARRLMTDMYQEKPELKKYGYLLDNEMALSNIAAGLANMLSVNDIAYLSVDLDSYIEKYQSVDTKGTSSLRLKNQSIKSVVNFLKRRADKDPKFMDKLVKLVEESAEICAVNNLMQSQKVR